MLDWDTMYDCSPNVTEPTNPQDNWTKVYPVFVRMTLPDTSQYAYIDTLVYVASSKEAATEWCSRNTDIETHNDKNWWWFVITQEAIDGEFSGIRGVMCMLDWNSKAITSQPLDGYNQQDEQEQAA